jgi:hypothetical protein
MYKFVIIKNLSFISTTYAVVQTISSIYKIANYIIYNITKIILEGIRGWIIVNIILTN